MHAKLQNQLPCGDRLLNLDRPDSVVRATCVNSVPYLQHELLALLRLQALWQ